MEGVAQPYSNFLRQWRAEGDTILARTSGSTGAPKDIVLQKSDMRASALASCRYFGITAESVLAIPLAVDYIAGKMMAVRAEVSGATLLPLPVVNALDLSDIARIDLISVVPTQLPALEAHPEWVAKIRSVLVGGAAPDVAQCRRLQCMGYNIYVSYGMTETCSHVAIASAADNWKIFCAMPGISFEVDIDGRLIICAETMSFGRLQTNDVVTLHSPQTFTWRGRADGVINSGGIKLFPEELEALYRPLIPSDIAFYVCAAPDPKWGQAVCLVAECAQECLTGIEASLHATIADHRRLPKQYKAVPQLPRTRTGKVHRTKP